MYYYTDAEEEEALAMYYAGQYSSKQPHLTIHQIKAELEKQPKGFLATTEYGGYQFLVVEILGLDLVKVIDRFRLKKESRKIKDVYPYKRKEDATILLG